MNLSHDEKAKIREYCNSGHKHTLFKKVFSSGEDDEARKFARELLFNNCSEKNRNSQQITEYACKVKVNNQRCSANLKVNCEVASATYLILEILVCLVSCTNHFFLGSVK